MQTDMHTSAGGQGWKTGPLTLPRQRMGMGLDDGGCKMRQKLVSCTFGESTMEVGWNVNRNSCAGAFSVAL